MYDDLREGIIELFEEAQHKGQYRVIQQDLGMPGRFGSPREWQIWQFQKPPKWVDAPVRYLRPVTCIHCKRTIMVFGRRGRRKYCDAHCEAEVRRIIMRERYRRSCH